MPQKPDLISYPPRGLSREEAARYVGVSARTFDQMIADGLMPKPKRQRGRVIWDRIALDLAFNDLPDEAGNKIDEAKRRGEAARLAGTAPAPTPPRKPRTRK